MGRQSDSSADGGQQARGVRRAAIIIAVIAGLAVAGFFGYQALAGKRLASRRFGQAVTAIERADKLVAQVDATVAARVEAGIEPQATKAISQADDATAQLNDALDLLNEAAPDLTGEQKQRAAALVDAVRARIDMMSYAPKILEVAVKASIALPKAESAWKRAVDADGVSDQAVIDYNKLTTEGVQASSKLNKRAGDELAASRKEFLEAEAALPESELEVYIAYVDARIALNELSQRSDVAWLAGDITKANQLIALYNTEDKKVVAQGKELPSAPAVAVAKAYDAATSEAFDKYYAAREKATQADKRAGGV